MKKVQILFFTILIFSSCKKDKNCTNKNKDSLNLTFICNEFITNKNIGFVKIKNNSSVTILGDTLSYSLVIKDIYMVNKDYYLLTNKSSITGNSEEYSVIYKNGIAILELKNNDTFNSTAIAVFNSEIYLLGTGIDSSGNNTRIKLWENRVLKEINKGSMSSTNDLMINEFGDVFISGSEFTNTFYGKIWKNGTEIYSSDGATYKKLYFENNNLYACGSINNKPSFWKNNNLTPLSIKNGECSDFKIIGDNVFITGYLSDGLYNHAVYWKNNIIEELTNSSNSPKGSVSNNIEIIKNDIYIGGAINQNNEAKAAYWINSNKSMLELENNNNLYIVKIIQ